MRWLLRLPFLFGGLWLAWQSAPVSAFAAGPPATAPVVRFLAGGDSRDDRSQVIPWAFTQAKERGAAAFLFLGDMELVPTRDGHFLKELHELDPVLFYPVLGNHEVKLFETSLIESHEAKKFRARFLDNARTPVKSALSDRVVYSVDLPGGVHFVALDNVSHRGFGADQLSWLEKDLQAARADPKVQFIVVGMHKPLAKNGVTTHGMDEDGPGALADSEAALSLFQKARVSLILESHLHEYAAYSQGGIQSYITGGLGAPLHPGGPDHSFHHLLEIEVHQEGLKVNVIRFPGPSTLSPDGADD